MPRSGECRPRWSRNSKHLPGPYSSIHRVALKKAPSEHLQTARRPDCDQSDVVVVLAGCPPKSVG
eukprot:1082694-Lingulodinium_polyedra.AAC.1